MDELMHPSAFASPQESVPISCRTSAISFFLLKLSSGRGGGVMPFSFRVRHSSAFFSFEKPVIR